MSYLDNPLVERASVAATADAYEHSLRLRFRNAPADFKAAVERDRAARGLEPLWPKSAIHRQEPARQKPTRSVAYVVAGVVAPHLSNPVVLPDQSQRMRECFAPECWHGMLDQVKQGRHVRLLDRHGGVPLATTANGSLRLEVDEKLGLTLVAELVDTSASRRLAESFAKYGLPLSIGFVALKAEQTRILGQEVRRITSGLLDHVAALGDARTPAYPGANLAFAASADPADVRSALATAKERAYLRLAG
jgi:phage head maturation protease